MCGSDGGQGVVSKGAGLEDSLGFQWPWGRGRRLPGFEIGEKLYHRFEVGGKIGSKIEAGALSCPVGHQLEELRLHESVFMVTFLGPWIRE